jgi:hypothetical protein
MLENWNAGLKTLKPAIVHPDRAISLMPPELCTAKVRRVPHVTGWN